MVHNFMNLGRGSIALTRLYGFVKLALDMIVNAPSWIKMKWGLV